jgi:hypothetical protein
LQATSENDEIKQLSVEMISNLLPYLTFSMTKQQFTSKLQVQKSRILETLTQLLQSRHNSELLRKVVIALSRFCAEQSARVELIRASIAAANSSSAAASCLQQLFDLCKFCDQQHRNSATLDPKFIIEILQLEMQCLSLFMKLAATIGCGGEKSFFIYFSLSSTQINLKK